MGYFKEKYDEMKARRDEKKEMNLRAAQEIQRFKDTVYYHNYKKNLGYVDIRQDVEKIRAEIEKYRKELRELNKESSGDLLKTGEKFGKFVVTQELPKSEGDSRYRKPKIEPSVTDERADQVIDETEIYFRARQAMLDGQRRQVKYGIEKYPEPLNASTWTILETIRHIKEEAVDTLHYLTMLEIKFEELAKLEMPSAGRRMKEEAEEQSKQFYFEDKPYDMNYNHVKECPVDECCGNPRGCVDAGTEIRPDKLEPPKTPNQVRKSYGLDFAYDGLPIKTEDIMLKKDGIKLENSDILNVHPIDLDNVKDGSGMYLNVVEKEEVKPVDLEAIEAGILRETPIKVKEVKRETLAEFMERNGLPYCTNDEVVDCRIHNSAEVESVEALVKHAEECGVILSGAPLEPGKDPAPVEIPGVVTVYAETLGIDPIKVFMHTPNDVRYLEMAIEEQRARANMRKSQ